MARARLLKPGFFTNDDLARLPVFARLLFQGLWCIADREGRLEDRPARIKVEVLPYDDVSVDELLTKLHVAMYIERYEIDGERYIQIQKFGKHQSPHIKEPASTIPAPDSPGASTVQAPPVSAPLTPVAVAVIDPVAVAVAREARPAAAAAPRRRDYVAVENLTGILNKTVADAIDEFRGEHPNVSEEWIEAACEEAAASNVRNWKYVKAILIRWGNDGFKADKRSGRVGASGSTGGVEPATLAVVGSHPGLPAFDFAAAEQRREDNEARLAARRAAGSVGAVPTSRDTYGSEGDQDSELSSTAL